MFKLLVWDCYAWCAWQFFQVKDRKGNYRDIPGNWNQYAGYFPLWRVEEHIPCHKGAYMGKNGITRDRTGKLWYYRNLKR